MRRYRYHEWDGNEVGEELDREELMSQLSDNLINYGNLSQALRMLTYRGLKPRSGAGFQGLRELLEQLRARRREQLEKYNLASIFDEIKERLQDALRQERKGIEDRLKQAKAQQEQGGEEAEMGRIMENVASKKKATLDNLPDDPIKAIKELTGYEFLDSEARRQFQELMEILQKTMLESYFRDIYNKLDKMTPEEIDRLKNMAADLNEMLRERARGGKPDFQQFMDKYGDLFGPQKPSSLDELIERLQQQRAAMQSLLDNLPGEMKDSLKELTNSKFLDSGLQQELSQLMSSLERLYPSEPLRRQYSFRGEESISFSDALRVMDKLQKMEDLEKQLERGRYWLEMKDIKKELVQDLLGKEAAESLERLKQVTKILEESGYIKQSGGKYELTPRGMRRIGQKALQDVFALIKQDRFGKHETTKSGIGADRSDDTKRYEFGDPFLLDMEKTLMNSLQRNGAGVPVKLSDKDFEVYRTEYLSQCSTVIMLDLSLSMAMRGSLVAAKKVALALSNLIQTQFPRDNLYIVGFSRHAEELKIDELLNINVDEFAYGTNMQHGLMLAEKLLSRHRSGTRQIIMITDGEPTAYSYKGQWYFEYPPSSVVLRETLREVKRCTEKGIIINTFMLERTGYLRDFVDELTKLNRGRAFYTTPEKLGQYVLVDYLANKRKRISA